jgi:long-chain fatty acid transport protein
MLRGTGAINESMAGAATACPLDSLGAIRFNPATISGLSGSEMSLGMALILPDTELGSGIGPISGWTESEPGVIPVPTMAFVHQVKDTPWSVGMGIYGVGGSAVNYPSTRVLENPILSPQPPYGVGLGKLSANVDVCQIAPVASYAVNEHLSIGFGPTITLGKLYCSPLFLGPQFSNDIDGLGTYSSGVGTRYLWGGGFEAGAYYTTDVGWHFGASVTSPQWLESARFKTTDELGRPETVNFAFNLPLVASLGVAYSGLEKWVFAVDARYFDYAHTAGFKESGFNDDGSVRGLGWESIGSLHLGVQRQLGDRFFVRGGYSLNGNPITAENVIYNVASPLIIKHSLHTGASYIFADNWMASLAYVRSFENDAVGELKNSDGTIPGGWVGSTAAADTLAIELTKRF